MVISKGIRRALKIFREFRVNGGAFREIYVEFLDVSGTFQMVSRSFWGFKGGTLVLQ